MTHDVTAEAGDRTREATRSIVRILAVFGVVIAGLGMSSCGSESTRSTTSSTADVGEYAIWWLASTPLPGATELQLTAMHGSCDELGTAPVVESDSTVVIDIPTPWIGKLGPNGEKGCDSAGHLVPMTVHLDAPLGDRQLQGCRHDDQPCSTIWGS
jgi:hypothetical protein